MERFLYEELDAGINKGKINKSPGPDGYSFELFIIILPYNSRYVPEGRSSDKAMGDFGYP